MCSSRAFVLLLILLGAFAPFLASCQKPATPDGPKNDEPKSLPFFEDVTATSGIIHTYRNGEEEPHYPPRKESGGKRMSPYYAIVESLGGGLGMIDFDGDGLLDIFVAGGGYYDGPDLKQIKGHPNRLYKNMGNFKFKDVTTEAGLHEPLFFSHGCAVGDYNRDGWPDLLVTGYGRVALYRNDSDGKGGRKFTDVTREVGLLGDHFWATSAGFADFDGDGWVDLYVCQYVNWSFKNNPKCGGYHAKAEQDVCPPKTFQAVPHALYRNDGKGRFIDVTREAGIRVDRRAEVPALREKLQLKRKDLEAREAALAKEKGDKKADEKFTCLEREVDALEREIARAESDEFGKGLGVVIVDVNGDGKPDIYVANDTVDNFLYINKSKPGLLRFDEVGLESGVARDDAGNAQGSMGVDAADFDGRGLPALWVTNYEGESHALYRCQNQNGRTFFNFATNIAGIAAIGQQYVGFGTVFLDVDNDGWEDIFISNGHVIRHPSPAPLAQKPVLFINQGEGKFLNITGQEGPYFQTGHRGRGVALGDLDNDGLPDLAVSHVQEPVSVLRNVSSKRNHWLGAKLIGKDDRCVVGAKVTLEVNGRKLTRFARGGRSYLSASDSRHLFGLASSSQPGRLTVHWPHGEPRVEHWTGLAKDAYHPIRQGTGKQH